MGSRYSMDVAGCGGKCLSVSGGMQVLREQRMWLTSAPGGVWSVTMVSLIVSQPGRGCCSPCGGWRYISPWAPISNLGGKTALSSVRWVWLASTPGGSWSVTLIPLAVPSSGRGHRSPCSLSPWATFLSMVTGRVVELFVLLALACQ